MEGLLRSTGGRTDHDKNSGPIVADFLPWCNHLYCFLWYFRAAQALTGGNLGRRSFLFDRYAALL
jgi:hypothetical protein